jgi:hypothetical protein
VTISDIATFCVEAFAGGFLAGLIFGRVIEIIRSLAY